MIRPSDTVHDSPHRSPRARRTIVRNAISAATVVAALTALSACTSGALSSGQGSGETAANTLQVVAPDTTIGWAPDDGAPEAEAQINTQATLLRKPYVASSSGTDEQDENAFDGYLASGYTVSPDGKTYTFTLRNATSLAGDPLTTEDVIYTFTRKFNSPLGNGPSVWKPVLTSMSQFKVISTHQFSITIANPAYGTTLLALLSDRTTQIYDATLLKKHATAKDPYAVLWSSKNPNYGFGPYEVKSYTPDVSVLLQANPHFVLGAAKIKYVSIKIVADAGTRANALQNGQANYAESLVPSDMSTLKSTPGVKIATVDSPNQFILIPLVTNKAPFNNTAVRQAFGYAVPYQQIIQNVYYGLAKRTGPSFLPSNTPGYDGSGFTDFTYDPAKAKAMLAAAGFPNGVSFALTVSSAFPDTEQSAVQIQTYAKSAGFNVSINQLPDSAVSAGISNGSFQAFVKRDNSNTMTPIYELGIYTGKTSTNNLAKWIDPQFYAAEAAAAAVPDPASPAAGDAFNAAERILVNQAPIIFVARLQPSVAMASNVDGYAWRSDNQTDFYNMSLSANK